MVKQGRELRICILSVTKRKDDEQDQAKALRRLWNLSDRRHSIVSDPASANLCIVCNLAGPRWFEDLRANACIRKFPDKCFAVHDGDIAVPLLHGIYNSVSRFSDRFGRIRAGAYNLFPHRTRNPFVEEVRGNAYLAPKKTLCSFRGQDSSDLRIELFGRTWPSNVEIFNSTRKYTAFADKYADRSRFQREYCESLVSSKFALCPRGKSPSSLRLFEAMQAGVAPVILSDALRLPSGPAWKEFALIVPEKSLNKLPDLLLAVEKSYQQRGRKARTAYETFFSDDSYFNYVVGQMEEIKSSQKVSENVFWSLRHLIVSLHRVRRRLGSLQTP